VLDTTNSNNLSKHRMAPPLEDPEVEEFLSNVDDVSMLIEGLKSGTISPDYIDRRQELKTQSKASSKPDPKQIKQQAAPQKPLQQLTEEEVEKAKEEEEARQARLLQKVEELKASRALKFQARQRYEDYIRVSTPRHLKPTL